MADVTVCVVGLGYIGLPTAALLASRGYQVHGVDIRPDVVATVNRGVARAMWPTASSPFAPAYGAVRPRRADHTARGGSLLGDDHYSVVTGIPK